MSTHNYSQEVVRFPGSLIFLDHLAVVQGLPCGLKIRI